MRKKVLAMMLATTLVVTSLTGCGGAKDEGKATSNDTGKKTETEKQAEPQYASDAKIKVWASQEDQKYVKKVIESFKADNEVAKDWNIETSVVSSADAKNEVLKDPTAAADLFEFASDQIVELKDAGVLYRVTRNKDQIIENNIEGAIGAGTIEGELYGYPTASNSYFMYYDKSKYSEDEVKNLNTMLEKDLDKGVTNFSMDLDNGWYTSSFFFGVGCKLFGDDGMDATKCDFNNEQGVLVGDYLLDLTANKKVKNQDDALLLAGFKEGSLAASITGTWNAKAIKESLGDNFGVAVMPSITLDDGQEIAPSSIVNYNLIGVNAQTKYPAESMFFAEYLSNEQSQKLKFEMRESAPTNKKLAEDKELLASSPAIATLSEQVKTSTNQPSIAQMGNFWGPMEAFGQDCIAKVVTKDNMQEKLDEMVKNILTRIGE